jgi:fatty-acid desaturase
MKTQSPGLETAAATQPGKPDRFIIWWMVIVHILAVASLFWFSWQGLLAWAVLHFATGCLGITLGYHRLLTHRSFKAPKWLERTLAFFGILSLEGSPLEWVSHHRMHHSHVDTPKDPHNARAGFWFSHIGWLFRVVPEFDDVARQRRFARDIVADPVLMFLGRPVVMIAIQVALGALLWAVGGFGCMMMGIFLRLVTVYHITWFVNSAAHMWGYRNWDVDDISRNNWWVAILAFGEGWHNNHHAFPDVAPAGIKWWEFDLTFMIIRGLSALGIVTDVKMPETHVVDQLSMGGAPGALRGVVSDK